MPKGKEKESGKLPRRTEELLHLYERYLSPLALISGFVLDSFVLFRRIDLWTSHLLLFFYLVIAALGITLLNLIQIGRLRNDFWIRSAPFLPVAAQFSFGGLFSAYVILYSRSAAYSASWIFVILLAALLLGNERFTRLYSRFNFQIGILFTVLFSFLIFYVPLLFGRIGSDIFLVSGALALLLMTGFLRGLYRLVPELVRANGTKIARSMAVIFVVFNILYFTNAIPPLPLSLKDAGVYHKVEKAGDAYLLEAEPSRWYEAYLRYNTVFHRAPGESVFVYSAVFAPTKFSTTILHEWEYYDGSTESWVRSATLGFPITGGRDGGYRGFSIKENVEAGKWRVNVKTGEGKIIGRISFTIIGVPAPVRTEEQRG